MSNPTLGVINCPTCNTEGAEVRQTKRRGARLYWQCAECGLNQPTGAKIQAKLWQETQWSEGAAPLRPGNVSSEAVVTEPETEFDPNEADAGSDPQPTSQPASQPSKAKGLGVLLLASLGLGVFLSAR